MTAEGPVAASGAVTEFHMSVALPENLSIDCE